MVDHPPPPHLDNVDFDLDQALQAMVFLHVEVPEDALTAAALGTERSGHGVLIEAPGTPPGLILTIAYLVTEATSIWVIDAAERAVPGHVVGVDSASGLALVQPLQPIQGQPLTIGHQSTLRPGEAVVVAGHGGRAATLSAWLVARQRFTGYWEYLLDNALLTSPIHPNWGGTALLGPDGRLYGIGSLLVQSETDGETSECNLFVPADLLPPILDDLLRFGRVNQPPRPWLGLIAAEQNDTLMVLEAITGSPADRAGLRSGDLILAIGGRSVADLAELFQTLWDLGAAGIAVPLTLSRNGKVMELEIISGDRHDYLKSPVLH